MGNSLGSARRAFGTFCLMVPVGMVILGLTALKHSLDGFAFVVYWLICFLFTFAAIIVALIDLRSVQRQTREETQELFEKTLGDIERQRDEKRGRGG